MAKGQSSPIMGWYSPSFGIKEPSITLVGEGFVLGDEEFMTVLSFSLE
jgi:hypothetical protein